MKFKKRSVCGALVLACALLISSCGYRIIGSAFLPFNSITIKPVVNKTYEPKLEDSLHFAFSSEFISQGIKVLPAGGDAELQVVVTTFDLGVVGAVDETVQEQRIIMWVDVTVTDNGRVIDFKDMRSPIDVTFDATGTVSETVANKERAIDKTSREIAKDVVKQLVMRYVK